MLRRQASSGQPADATFSLDGWQRVVVLLAGLVLVAGLVIATRLTPSPLGLGTHHQLGFSPCTIRVWFGLRCPACGMTTSWAHVVRGDLVRGCRANCGGVLLAFGALLLGPWLTVSGCLGRWWPAIPEPWYVAGALTITAVVTMIDWLSRLLAAAG